MNNEQIEKCPFCGHLDMHLLKTNTAFAEYLPNEMYHVACENCAAFGPLEEIPVEAIGAWNDVSRRASGFIGNRKVKIQWSTEN